MTPYDEAKHRNELGLAEAFDLVAEVTVDPPLDFIGSFDDSRINETRVERSSRNV